MRVKRIIGIIFLLLATAVLVNLGFSSKEIELESLNLSSEFTITAHTGCLGTEENTIDSMKVGMEYADTVEFDVLFDASGYPVLSHDALKGGEARLEEALKYLAQNKEKTANVDIKKVGNLEAVQNIAEQTKTLSQIFYTGIEEKDVEAVKSFSPKIKYFLNIKLEKRKCNDDEYLLSLVKKTKDCGAIGINMNKKLVNEKIVRLFHENSLLVSIYTVDSRNEIKKILSLGVDNITTRRPDIVLQIVNAF